MRERAAPVEMAGAFLVRDGRALLGLRAADKRLCPDCWDAIGGHLEPGETPLQALTRELHEEIGVRVIAAQPLPTLTDGSAMLHLFRVDRWQGEPVLADAEHVSLRWVDADEAARLPNLAVDAYRAVLREMLTPSP